jgi:purine-cytosine permease-like protein
MSEWTFGQKALVVLAALQLLWATAGFIAEPSFHFGADAPTEKVLGVDFNGVHALSGFLLFLPAFYFARRPDWAFYYDVYVAAALFITGVWALFDEQPAWVFTFPNNSADGIFHLATGTLFAILAAMQWSENQSSARLKRAGS